MLGLVLEHRFHPQGDHAQRSRGIQLISVHAGGSKVARDRVMAMGIRSGITLALRRGSEVALGEPSMIYSNHQSECRWFSGAKLAPAAVVVALLLPVALQASDNART